ncbi:MAG: heavy-metal-associated domain-containing protein [Campylobacterota bacterium]|nr:heavy-metal-associated domain-containing protein [Campylobacterota bacterium]
MLKSFEVDNIRCSGCVNSITKALEKEGFKSIEIDLSCEPRKVTIDIKNEALIAQFRAILRKLGYPFFDEEISFGNSATLKAKSFVSCAVGKFSIQDDTK